jgi:RHS repeat-associated protein
MNRGTFGNGVIENDGYNNRLQVSSICDVKGLSTCGSDSSTLFRKSFGYLDGAGHNNGDILSILDPQNAAKDQNFSYDSLNRIVTGSQTDNAFNITYSYDPWGNMHESGTSNFTQPFDNLNRIQHPPSCSPLAMFCYDAAGNLLMDNHAYSFAYDGEERIKTVSGTTPATYTYNPLGNRVRKDAGSVSTEYFFFGPGVIAELNPATSAWTDYVFGYGKRLAKDTSSNGSGAQYYQDDQLGSARIMTDSAGTVISNCTFNPFGEQVACSPDNPSNHYRFAGKERDSEDGLDDFGARYFSSSMGRWMTPDWSARPVTVPYAVFGDPQSLNLYLYVRNDPVSNADADGHVAGGCWMFVSCIVGDVEEKDSANKNGANNQGNANSSAQNQNTTPAPTNPDGSPAKPPNPPPPGKDGNPNEWMRVPGTGNRPDKWVPRDPVSSPKGGQPGASWDEKEGHWDVDDGNRNRTRWLPNGTQVDHYNNPIKTSMRLPTTKQVIIGIGALGTGYLIYRGVRMLPSLLIPPLWPTIPLNAAIP